MSALDFLVLISYRQFFGSFLDLLNLGIRETLDLEKFPSGEGDQRLNHQPLTNMHGMEDLQQWYRYDGT